MRILLSFLFVLFSTIFVFAGRNMSIFTLLPAPTSATECADSTCTGFLVCQNFETPTTGFDNSESWSDGGVNVRPAFTYLPLRGTQSLEIDATNDYIGTEYNFSASATVYGFFIFYSTGAENTVGVILSNAGTEGANIEVRGVELRMYHGSNYFNVGITYGVTNYVWFDYTAGTGSNGVAHMTISQTKVQSEGTTASLTNGTSTQSISRLRLRNNNATYPRKFDQVLLKTTVIGDPCN